MVQRKCFQVTKEMQCFVSTLFISINKRGFEGNNYGLLICNLDICKIVDSLCFLFKWRTFSTFITNPGFNRPIQIRCTRTKTERENKLFHSLRPSQTCVHDLYSILGMHHQAQRVSAHNGLALTSAAPWELRIHMLHLMIISGAWPRCWLTVCAEFTRHFSG